MSIAWRETGIPGCHELQPTVHADARGRFVKPFAAAAFAAAGAPFEVVEVFHSTSAAGVVRGLHYQRPPHACAKLVTCLAGAAFDVVLDLRADSPTAGRQVSVRLDADAANAVLVPAGCAHGFQALTDGTLLLYLQSAGFDAASDTGVRPDASVVAWPLPVTALSPRDAALPTLAETGLPFRLA
ncbi:MAG: dTDP-4-dehydrorhamnose 3,5-epimerase family protein [Gemmatimonadales bacterium]|nr:dTDP-4-dehydrorhamnose 3,5-epimerase family protein [Gemmatimonadales bacterium]